MQNTVKEHREAIGFSQERLGKVLGVSRSTVANWERGEQIKSTNLMQMVALFDCDVNTLLGLANETTAL
jgi:transcriptional regulator with XRE-family HTH domain